MKSRMPTSQDSVLVYRLGSLGDTIIALPAFHLIRDAFPEAKITVLTNLPVHSKAPPLAAVLENTGLFDDIIAYPVQLRGLAQTKRLRKQIAARRFHTLVSLAPSRGWSRSLRDWLFFRWCGIQRIIGIPFLRADLVCLPEPGTDRYEWEARRLVRRLECLGKVALNEDAWWDLRLTEAEEAAAERLLFAQGVKVPFLAISAGTKVEVKDWGERNWRELIARLDKSRPNFGLVAFGSTEESDRALRLLAEWSGPAANLCGWSGPRVSAAILQRAELFLGHDSGPMHLAACAGTPCVAIFSARAVPGQWFPRGDHHSVIYHRTPCFGCELELCARHQKKCIASITVDEVLAAVQRHLPQVRSAHEEPVAHRIALARD
jgi:ADP-heptose:LPS heptosyltransferase